MPCSTGGQDSQLLALGWHRAQYSQIADAAGAADHSETMTVRQAVRP